MRAIVVVPSSAGGGLEPATLPVPVPGPTEVLVRVHAASLNRADLAQRAGASAPTVAGLDAAGEVAALGSAVREAAVGDRVMAKVAGGYAEYVAVDARLLLPVPDRLSFAEAAASVLPLLTEYDALVDAGGLAPGETVVVHAAASGVGQWGLQLARELGAGRVLGTVRSGRSRELLTSLGADRVVDVSTERFADVVLEETREAGADVVVDHVGGPYLAENVRCLAIGGRLVDVGRLGGAEGTLDLEAVAFKRLRIVGTTFRTRSLEDHAAIVAGVARDVLPAVAAGRLRPVVDRVVPLEDALEAQHALARDEPLGKIVLQV
jgi:putative PIG3 family NAD(P)H quinone oxidoreductase